MPRYKFVGFSETVLQGLSHAVNAVLHREDHGQPDFSTVVAQPGDEVETDQPYPHALMVNLETGVPDLEGVEAPAPPKPTAAEKRAAAKAAKEAAAKAAQSPPAPPVTDPAPTGAPAPGEPAPPDTGANEAPTNPAPTEGQE